MGLLVSKSCISQMNENFPSCTISYRGGFGFTRTCVSSFRGSGSLELGHLCHYSVASLRFVGVGSELWAWDYGGASKHLSTMQKTQV